MIMHFPMGKNLLTSVIIAATLIGSSLVLKVTGQIHQYQQHTGTNTIAGETDYDYPDTLSNKFSANRGQFIPTAQKLSKIRPPPPLSPNNGVSYTKSTPIPILKQINRYSLPTVTSDSYSIVAHEQRHNEDGSYTYGFEAADGSYKIETKTSDGEVFGKYGYIDDSGKLRIVEYGANKYGFRPSGEGIQVPAPTLNNDHESDGQNYSADDGSDFGQDETAHDQQKQNSKSTIFQAVSKRKTTPQTPKSSQEFQRSFSFLGLDNGATQTGYREPKFPLNGRQRQMQRRPYQGFDETRNSGSEQQLVGFQNGDFLSKIFDRGHDENFESQHDRLQGSNNNFLALPSVPRVSSAAKSQPMFSSNFESANQSARSFSSNNNNYKSDGEGSILDQLIKQYALPPNGSPAISDLSYGFF